jgi:PAS domain S-box-containing protein
MADDKSLTVSLELRDVKAALQESEERFRHLVANVEDHAIFLLDASGHVSSWTAAAERLEGYTAREILGKHFSAFYPAEAVEREWPDFQLAAARGKGRFADEGWRVRKDGTRHWAGTVITAIHGPAGTVSGYLAIVRDLTERRTQETSLRETEEHFRLLVDGVEEYAIFMLDPQGNVVSWNRGAERIKGYRASEIIGTHFSRFYPTRSVLEGKPAWELEMATRYGSFEDEGWRIRKDGSQFWANVVITALRDKTGRLRGFAKVTRDMTERRRIEDLENADRQKDQFLALLAHELRNPLAPIRTAIEVLRREKATPAEIDQARDIAERQLRHMARLLDDLLDVSRVREGRIELRMEILDVGSVMRSAAQATGPLIESRHHTLTVVDPESELLVRADPVRLEQVLGNLLNNAAKYTDPGGQIHMSAEQIAGEAVIRVRDSGVGIEPLMIPRVFDLFVQAERRTELSAGGVGIGLSVVKKLVELHGGHVEAISAGAGRGSEFIVGLPAVERKPGERVTTDVPARPSPLAQAPLRVLLVDDNADSADGLAMLLELQGHETRVAYDGESALETARSFRPHAALLDIGMPSMDGYELARRLRAAPETKETMLVAMTGWGQEEDQRKGREAGFAHHLVKPFEPSAVEKVLANYAETLGSNSERRSGSPALTPGK